MDPLLKKPSAWLPLAMSFAALMLLLGYMAFVGVEGSGSDEGAAARIFQILLAAQIPIIIYFALKWAPESGRKAVWILALQILFAFLPFALVYYLEM